MFSVNSEIQIPFSELEFTYVRSSGPGGQNVNKVSSKAMLRWSLRKSCLISRGQLTEDVLLQFEKLFPAHLTKEGELLISSQKTRDAPKNRDDCLEKLRNMILEAIKVPKPRIVTKRTRGSIRRRLENKEKQSQKKQSRRKIDFGD